ncbi:hypothetical protein N7467_005464 [Penicillium canescens]|nr:hypothetical protein N7467_005464 [Penicillium canescens]
MQTPNIIFHDYYSKFAEKANCYREYVSSLAGQGPGLSYLDLYLNDPRYLSRETFPITVVKLNTQQDDTNPELKTFAKSEKIDPQFWADYLIGPGWFGSGKVTIGSGEPEIIYRDDSILEQLWPLPTDARAQKHVCFRFIAHKARNDTGNNSARNGPVSTLYPIVENAWVGPPYCANTTPTRGNLTIWENWQDDGLDPIACPQWVGVVAIESQSSVASENIRWSPYVFKEFSTRPNFDEKTNMDDFYITGNWEGRPQRAPKRNNSIREIYSNHLKIHLRKKEFLKASVKKPSLLFTDLYRLLGSFWVTEIESQHLRLSWMEMYFHREYAKRKLKFLPFDWLFPNPSGGLPAKLEVELFNLHRQRMVIGPYRHLIGEVWDQAAAKKDQISENLSRPIKICFTNTYGNLAYDFKHLEDRVLQLDRRIARISEFLRSISDDFEAERSSYRNQVLLILSVWAWLISPISLLSSILGLENTESQHHKVGDVNVFWKALIPLVITVFSVVCSTLAGTQYYNYRKQKVEKLIEKPE